MKLAILIPAIGILLTGFTGVTYCQPINPSDSVKPAVVWQYQTTAPINATPIVDGGMVYFGGFDSIVHALELSTGKPVWTFRTRGEIRSTACLHGNRLYFVSGDGKLYCLDKETGKLVWTFATQGEKKYDFADYYHSSPVIRGENAFFGSGDGNIYAIHLSYGSKVWSYATGGVVHGTPALDSNRLFVGSFDGYLYALNVANGDLLWKFKSVGHRWFPKGEFQGSPTVGGGLVFIGARDYNLYAVDQEKGFCHWNKQFTRGWALANRVIDTVLYTGTSDDRVLVAAVIGTGRELWRTDLHFNIFGGMATSGSTGYVGTLLGKLYAVDLNSGRELWAFGTDGYKENRLKYFKEDDSFRDDIFDIVKSDAAFIDVEHEIGAIFSTPVVSDDYLIVTSTDGGVYCLRR